MAIFSVSERLLSKKSAEMRMQLTNKQKNYGITMEMD
nr:MAG TPA: hypothetical protein [Caudoviricetes sp.]